MSNYTRQDGEKKAVARIWKRLGMAPYQGRDKSGNLETKMPASWRRDGGLSKEQWTEIGYCPRRRSVMYVVASGFVRQGGASKKTGKKRIGGPYWKFYQDVKKVAKKKHKDWIPARVNNHAILLTGKRLIRDLYREWNRVGLPGFLSQAAAPRDPPQPRVAVQSLWQGSKF